MQGWFGFYAAIGGFAATLLGLLFVAVSINAAAILGNAHENSKRLAEQAFQNYLAVMMVALLAIFPTLEISTLGFATLAVTAVWAAWVLIRSYLTLMRPREFRLACAVAASPALVTRRVRNAHFRRRPDGVRSRGQPQPVRHRDHDPAVLGDGRIVGAAFACREDFTEFMSVPLKFPPAPASTQECRVACEAHAIRRCGLRARCKR